MEPSSGSAKTSADEGAPAVTPDYEREHKRREKGNKYRQGPGRSVPGIVSPVLLFLIGAEFPATVAFSFGAGLNMDGDRCPGVLGIQVRFEMVGQVMGLDNGDIPGYHEMELDEDLRPRAPCFQVMKSGIDTGVLADDLLDPRFIRLGNAVVAEIGEWPFREVIRCLHDHDRNPQCKERIEDRITGELDQEEAGKNPQ